MERTGAATFSSAALARERKRTVFVCTLVSFTGFVDLNGSEEDVVDVVVLGGNCLATSGAVAGSALVTLPLAPLLTNFRRPLLT